MTVLECVSEVVGILGDAEMVPVIEGETELTTDQVKLKNRYISGLNIAVDTIASRYYASVREVRVVSDEERRIDYNALSPRVYEVLSVREANGGQGVDYYTLPFCLYVPNAKKEYVVKFKFLPEKCEDLDEEIDLLPFVSPRAVVYLMVSDILLSKNIYDESKFWFSKFESEMTQAVSNRRMRTLKVSKII